MSTTKYELPAESVGMYKDEITKKVYEVFKVQKVISQTFLDGTTETVPGLKRFYCQDVDGKHHPINLASEDFSTFKLVIGNNLITKIS